MSLIRISLEYISSQPFEVVANGREIRINCPNCDDTTKHLYYNTDKHTWYCFKCGKGGKVDLVQGLEPNLERYTGVIQQYSNTQRDKFIARIEEIEERDKTIKSLPLNSTLPSDIEIPEDCSSGEELNARNYLHKRGITQEMMDRYSIRVSLEQTGPYRNSIIFPVYSPGMGTIEYFVCRKYDDSKPKYVNAPWAKGETLYIARNEKCSDTYIIVEGIFDALAIASAGHVGIALLGKTATSQQLSRLSSLHSGYIIYLDEDALSQAVHLKLQLDALDNKSTLLRHSSDAADLYMLDKGKYLNQMISYALK